MLTVQNGELMVEEKAIYSIEKFLVSRRLMYWQVYLHKTVLCAEQMLQRIIKRAKYIKAATQQPLNNFINEPIANGNAWKNFAAWMITMYCQRSKTGVIMLIKYYQYFAMALVTGIC